MLEINPRHPILKNLSEQPADGSIAKLIIELIYEDALLIEGLHPDPAGMVGRVQDLMNAALTKVTTPKARKTSPKAQAYAKAPDQPKVSTDPDASDVTGASESE